MKRILLLLVSLVVFLPTMAWAQDTKSLRDAIAQRPRVRIFGEYQNRVLYGVRKQYPPEVLDLVDIGFEYALYEESVQRGTRLIAPEVQRAKYDSKGDIYTLEKFTLIYRGVDGTRRILRDRICDFVLDEAHDQMLIAHHISPIRRTYELTDLQAKALSRKNHQKMLIGREFSNPRMAIFSPDGTRVFFASNVDKYTYWHVIDIINGKSQRLTEKRGRQRLRSKQSTIIPMPTSRKSVRVTPDGFLEYVIQGETIRIDMDKHLIYRGGQP